MRWSALKSATEHLFAPSLSGRVAIYATRHHKPSSRGSAWLVIDGVEIARACDWIFTRTKFRRPELVGLTLGSSGVLGWGEASAFDMKIACWELVHGGADAALASDHHETRALALLHRKVGKARVISAIHSSSSSPFELALASFRAECEGWLKPSSFEVHPV